MIEEAMTVTLNLKPEVEAGLLAQADRPWKSTYPA
jgi:hypothetical protein